MRIQEVPGGMDERAVVTLADGQSVPFPLTAGDEVRILEIDRDQFVLRNSASECTVVGHGHRNAAVLSRSSSAFAIGLIESVPGDGSTSITLAIKSLPVAVNVGTTVMLVPESTVAQIAADTRLSQGSVLSFLEEEFLATEPLGMRCAFLAQRGTPPASAQQSLRLIGRKYALDLQSSDGTMIVTRLARGGQGDVNLSALLGDLSFSHNAPDATGDGPEQVALSTQQYLSLWDGYSEKERLKLQQLAENIGLIEYDGLRFASGVVEVRVAPDSRDNAAALLSAWAAGDADRVEFKRPVAEPGRRRPALMQFEIMKGSTQDRLKLRIAGSTEPDTRPPNEGTLEVSLRGDEERLKRRKDAITRVRAGSGQIPRLPMLLETGAVIGPRSARGTPRMAKAIEEHFGESIRPDQREAIRVAVTTPDIALIQGPPGTGKTKVIAAIVDVLSRQAVDGDDVRILVASEQNEAVAHLEEVVTSASGVPPYGLGEPERGTSRWARSIADAIEVRWAAHDIAWQLAALREALAIVHGANTVSTEQARSVMDSFEHSMPRQVSGLQRRRVAELRREIDENDIGPGLVGLAHARGPLLRAVIALPQSGPSLADGGWLRAETVLSLLPQDSGLSAQDQSFIRAVANQDRQVFAHLSESAQAMAECRARLLDHLIAPQGLPGRDWSTKLQSVLGDCLEEIEATLNPTDLAALAALELASDLTGNPRAAARAHRQLAGAFTATNQTVASDRAARDFPEGEGVWFDTVIIDEAARANPLDLLIPMSLARRRIILVGDHRQLPQMLEPDIEKEMSETLSEAMRRALKESLFERLIGLISEQDEAASSKRVVRLFEQFRMHKWLGDFVGAAFYSDDRGLESPADESAYIHEDLTFAGQPGVWLDCPDDPEVRVGTSWARQAEADKCAALVVRWLDNCPTATIGAMSLYRAQTGRILEALSRLTTRDGTPIVTGDEEKLEVHEPLRDRLRVGNVDAFQGREFDHVAVCLTRRNGRTSGRAAFGFLALQNRLCVALSRQRKLLVVIGDQAMYETPLAAAEVPALYEYLRRCRESHAVR